jgi:hypothetical protein
VIADKRHKSALAAGEGRNMPYLAAKENLKWVAFLYRT